MKCYTLLLLGVSLVISATGCCCGPYGNACGYGAYGQYPSGGCPGGACSPSMYGPGYPAVIQQGAIYNGLNSPQMAAAPAPAYNTFAAAPMYYPQTAMAGGPLDPLPTY